MTHILGFDVITINFLIMNPSTSGYSNGMPAPTQRVQPIPASVTVSAVPTQPMANTAVTPGNLTQPIANAVVTPASMSQSSIQPMTPGNMTQPMANTTQPMANTAQPMTNPASTPGSTSQSPMQPSVQPVAQQPGYSQPMMTPGSGAPQGNPAMGPMGYPPGAQPMMYPPAYPQMMMNPMFQVPTEWELIMRITRSISSDLVFVLSWKCCMIFLVVLNVFLFDGFSQLVPSVFHHLWNQHDNEYYRRHLLLLLLWMDDGRCMMWLTSTHSLVCCGQWTVGTCVGNSRLLSWWYCITVASYLWEYVLCCCRNHAILCTFAWKLSS